MSSTESNASKVLDLDLEGVGRCNLAKSGQTTEGLPGFMFTAAGVNHPDSGRTDIHPAVIDVAKRRHGNDIAGWPVQRIEPEMVDKDTIVLMLCSPDLVPDFVLSQAKDVFLFPIADPFGVDIEQKLEVTTSQIAWMNWLLSLVLTTRSDEVGNSRDERGWIIPRYLVQFEPKNIEPEYSYDGWMSTAFPLGR